MVEQILPEGDRFYLFLSSLFGTVANICSSILGYQLYHFPYRLNVVSAFAQMLFALLLWRETEKSKHHMEEWEQVIVDQSVDVAPVGPPPTEA